MKTGVLIPVLAALAVSPLAAQRRLTGGLVTYLVRLSTPTEATSQTGSWVGGEGSATLGRYTLTVRGVSGSLGGNPVRVDRDARVTSISLRRRFAPWLALGLDAEAHRQKSDVSVQVWRMGGVGATLGGGLGVTRLQAHGDVTVLPVTSVVAARDISVGTRVEIGVTYRLSRWPVEAQFGYREETVRFPDAVDLRLGGLILGVGVRLGPS